MLQSTRNIIHLKITLSSVLQVMVFIPEEKLEWYNSDSKRHTSLLNSLYDIIVKHLITNGSKIVTKKGQETENMFTAGQAGEVYFTYYFKALEKHQTLIIRESIEDDIKEYKQQSIYPYQLLICVEEPQSKDKTIYNYFNEAVENHT